MKVGDKVKFKSMYQTILPLMAKERIFTVTQIKKGCVSIVWKSKQNALGFIIKKDFVKSLEIVT